MSDQIERLEKADEMLEEMDGLLDDDQFRCHKSLRNARQELQLTTGQIRESQQAAIELLTRLRDKPVFTSQGAYFLLNSERTRITKVIGLLDGSGEEGEDEAEAK